MKNFTRIITIGIFTVLCTITISQISRTAVAANPITAPVSAPIIATITPTPSPLPSATPTIPTSTPTPTSPDKQDSNNSGSHNSNGGSSDSNKPFQCNNAKPKTPFITSITQGKNNGITVAWSKIPENVSYYIIAYSRTPGQIEYATGHISADSNQFTIYATGKQTYYFKIRAGNGCMPGDFSPEVSMKNGKNEMFLYTSQFTQSEKNAIMPKKPSAQKNDAKSNKLGTSSDTNKYIALKGFWGFFGKILGAK